MGLRAKTALIISLTLVSLIAALYLVSRTFLLDSYANLEEQRARLNMERVLSVLSDQLANLETTTQDYAEWNDTYQFVTDGNQAYIESNLSKLTFADLKFNLTLFINASGNIVFGKTFDLEQGQFTDLPADLSKYISVNSPLINHPDGKKGLNGLILLPQGPMLIASRHILTNESQGPSRGTLIFGRYLDSIQVKRLAEITHLSLSIRLFNDPDLPPDFRAAAPSLSRQSPILVQFLNNDTAAGYALIEDIFGQPLLILRIDLPQTIYQQGQASIAYFMLSLLLTGLVFSLIVLWLLERMVLTRLLQLNTSVSKIGANADSSTRIQVNGNDELASLAQAINQMLESLQQSQTTLQKARDELERRVAERTKELSESNTQLKLEIAERQQIEETLVTARDRALEVSHLKTALLARVSHELRTPLAIILGYAETLELGIYGAISDEQRQATTEIINSSQYLTKFVNELLAQAQIEAGKLALNINNFALADLIRDTVTQMSFMADKKQLTLQVNIADDLPATISGDPVRIKQIITNLVGNAIKFTAAGDIQVCVYRPDPAHWALQVSDTGPGIPLEVQYHIFEPFVQGDGSITRQHGGAGLGLSIVKQLTDLMGGEIKLESQVGQGSTFTVTFPLQGIQEQ